MTKTERNNLYDEVLCGHLLAAVRKTLAVAPGIEGVWAGMVRTGEHGVGVERRAECLLVVRLYRKDLVDARWDETKSATILHARASEVAVHRSGRVGEFSALDPGPTRSPIRWPSAWTSTMTGPASRCGSCRTGRRCRLRPSRHRPDQLGRPQSPAPQGTKPS